LGDRKKDDGWEVVVVLDSIIICIFAAVVSMHNAILWHYVTSFERSVCMVVIVREVAKVARTRIGISDLDKPITLIFARARLRLCAYFPALLFFAYYFYSTSGSLALLYSSAIAAFALQNHTAMNGTTDRKRDVNAPHSETTPLLGHVQPQKDSSTNPDRRRSASAASSSTSWFKPIYRVLLSGFLVSLSFGVTQVPFVPSSSLDPSSPLAPF